MKSLFSMLFYYLGIATRFVVACILTNVLLWLVLVSQNKGDPTLIKPLLLATIFITLITMALYTILGVILERIKGSV